jgi:hypothetical protein
MKICTIPNCLNAYYAKGLCNKHYLRRKRGQDLYSQSVYEETPLERFSKKYTKAASGCWEWDFPRPDGRANTFNYDGKVQSAYRVSYQLHKGPIPEGLCVLHHCDNGLCVNPDHLFLGTHHDNYEDMRSKGRSNTAHGEQKKRIAKLTEEAVRDIKTSSMNGSQLAKKYGVDRRTVYDILDGKTWKHVVT